MTGTLVTGTELAGGTEGPKALAPLLAVALGA
ncbi:MAG: hypothetical protein JWM15_603, partial [Cryptosporangiaceae bacterium]|nr:hypothetical protein [Cryptosporangiaceae bacterium]